MDKVLLVLHLMIAAGLVGVVLLQRSEGGGLGMGGGGSGSFMTGRGTANFLTRVTAGLATAFFITSISLTLLARQGAKPLSPLDLPALNVPGATAPATPAPAGDKAATPAAAPGAPAAPAATPATPLPSAATPIPEKAKPATPPKQ